MKILFIQLRKMGDVLTTTPAIRQLKKKLPNAEIHFLTENLGANVYKFNNNINRLISIERKQKIKDFIKLILSIRKEKYDYIIDGFSNPKSAQICFFSGVKNKIGYKKGLRDIAYSENINLDKKVNNKYFYTPIHKLFLMEGLFKPDYNDVDLEMNIDEKLNLFGRNFCKNNNINKENTIAFCVVSDRARAKIKDKIYIELGNYLISKNKKLFFVYGPNEKEQILDIYNKIKDKSKVILNYKMTSILENRAILENCNFYLGNDGGTKHLSITSKIPTFAIFKDDKVENWTPLNNEKHKGIQYNEMMTEEKLKKELDIFIEKNNL